MKLLVSNDDGIYSPGLSTLATSLRTVAEVIVVAPDRNQSAASHSLTLERPLRIHPLDNNAYIVNGTPTDCVHLAITGMLGIKPAMVISGINQGANLGDDVLYSGTVAAAMEGRFLGFPAIAVSLVGEDLKYFSTAAEVAKRFVMRLLVEPLPANTILNINVPDVSFPLLSGVRVTRLGYRHISEPVVEGVDPRGGKVYWIGSPGREQDGGPDTDFCAVREGFVSVTPLLVDITAHEALSPLVSWVNELL
ncbi:MAG: 5'/3'-nucleotidase SurE [Gammaproteobacteria bacterium]|nr:5'/3'-nucleotidase SurE [Gammaproteobacteria bacterium]